MMLATLLVPLAISSADDEVLVFVMILFYFFLLPIVFLCIRLAMYPSSVIVEEGWVGINGLANSWKMTQGFSYMFCPFFAIGILHIILSSIIQVLLLYRNHFLAYMFICPGVSMLLVAPLYSILNLLINWSLRDNKGIANSSVYHPVAPEENFYEGLVHKNPQSDIV
uniref:Uncharacterized protein n=1 Tax=Odontella aurita TaxID=265563 RepID=A0A7S4N2U9_9STRA|mmetsp:Transcript_44761/g.136603  ORF Transcript_44761/g.136603 Transcript_44761/m.136603 type:complete len:167 (+) Transcript_44761:633-1133(+)